MCSQQQASGVTLCADACAEPRLPFGRGSLRMCWHLQPRKARSPTLQRSTSFTAQADTCRSTALVSLWTPVLVNGTSASVLDPAHHTTEVSVAHAGDARGAARMRPPAHLRRRPGRPTQCRCLRSWRSPRMRSTGRRRPWRVFSPSPAAVLAVHQPLWMPARCDDPGAASGSVTPVAILRVAACGTAPSVDVSGCPPVAYATIRAEGPPSVRHTSRAGAGTGSLRISGF